MARVDVLAYGPQDILEESDVTVGRTRELLERFPVTWVNVVDPDARTLEELETLFGFHPLALEDCVDQNVSPKAEVYDDVLFTVTRTITWKEEIGTDQLSMFLSKRLVVTIHDKVFPQLEAVRIRIRKKSPRMLKAGTDYLAYTILDAVVDSYYPHLDRFGDLLERLEEELVRDPTGTRIERIHDIRTDLLRLRSGLRGQRDAFATLTRMEQPFFKKDTRNYLRDVYDHLLSALDTLDTNREIVTGLMEVQATLVSNSLNEVIKVLTVIFTISIPLTIVTSAFGMNVGFVGRDQPFGLWIAIFLMLVATFGTILFLRWKRFL